MDSIPLSTPIPYGKSTLSELSFRAPTAGDLRGIKLGPLAEADMTTILKIAARVSITPIVEEQLYALSAPDSMKLMEVIIGFFGQPEAAQSPTTPTEPGDS